MKTRFRHSGKLGDLVYSLAAVSAFEKADLYIQLEAPFIEPLLTVSTAELLLPLIREQNYIERAEVWTGQAYDHDLDEFRKADVMNMNLADAHLRLLNLSLEHKKQAWLKVRRIRSVEGFQVVFARSDAHRGVAGFWEVVYQTLGHQAIFLGTEKEHQQFVQSIGPIPYVPTSDLLEAAEIIAGCRLFVGNQSCPLAIAEGLKVPLIQEVHALTPNCVFYRKDAYPVWQINQFPAIFDELGVQCLAWV